MTDLIAKLDELAAKQRLGKLIHKIYAYDSMHKWTEYFEDLLSKNPDSLTCHFVEIEGTSVDGSQDLVAAETGNGPTSDVRAEFIVTLANSWPAISEKLKVADELHMVLEHAIELGYLGEGSTRGMALDALENWRSLRDSEKGEGDEVK